jgi:hypothetical protein
MRTTPGPAGAHQQDSHQQPGRHRVGDPAPLTPAERIAVTIALVNCGLDMVDGLARTCFTGWARGLARGRHHPEQELRPEQEPLEADGSFLGTADAAATGMVAVTIAARTAAPVRLALFTDTVPATGTADTVATLDLSARANRERT